MKQQKAFIPPISWVFPAVLAIILGGIGGFVITAFGFRYGQPTQFLFFGLAMYIIAIFLGMYSFRELMADAHVRAMEVFNGQPRAVRSKPSARFE